MKIWVVKDGENLPFQEGARKMRTWLLAEELMRRGHEVTWWSSTFFHSRKSLLFSQDEIKQVPPRLQLRLLHAGSYRKNLSLGRYLHHRKLGKRFQAEAGKANPPDLILTAFPIIDLAWAAVRFAGQNNLPVVVDVRDYWPDTFLDFLPRLLRPLGRILFAGDFRRTRELLGSATRLAAISEACLRWGQERGNRSSTSHDRVFYMGYPDPGPPPESRPEGKITFLYIGSFGRSYDLDSICWAAAQLHAAKRRDIQFLLVGEGEQFSAVAQKTASLPNVTMTGWKNQEEILRLLRESHAGIIPGPQVKDPLPNKTFEYLAAGLPLVATVSGEIPRMIKQHRLGISCPPGDRQALLEAVRRLAGNASLREDFSRRARQCYEDNFQATSLYSAYADFLEDLALAGAARNTSQPSTP